MNAEHAKFTLDLFAPGLEHESQITRKVIAAIPEAKCNYKPDPSSRTALELAQHIATVDVWFLNGIATGAFSHDESTPAGLDTVAGVLAFYDREFPKALAKVKAMPAEKLAQPISFMGMLNHPGVIYLGLTNNHMIHHRGQLAAYLRPMGSKVPNIYGGSFDEPMQMPGAATA